jgi:AcrR family transcriptional regulator
MTTPLRKQILAASVKLIESKGLSSLSLREAARKAQVSHQAPYHYFKDKEALLAGIAEEGFGELAERLEKAGQKASALGQAYVDFAIDRPVHFRLMFQAEFHEAKRYPAVAEAQKLARGVLEKGRNQSQLGAAWSRMHGLASLLVDGPMGPAFKSDDARRAFARDVMKND